MLELRGGGKGRDRYTYVRGKDVDPADLKGVPTFSREEVARRGYVKHRPKKYRNPRKHYRYKAAALTIRERMKNGVQYLPEPANYVGETRGIKLKGHKVFEYWFNF